MRAVIQRVSEASVSLAGGEIAGAIGPGMTVLLGVSVQDSPRNAEYLADKLVHLRIFEDESGKLNRSLADIEGEMLVVSQFTLLGDCRKGRRPSFTKAAAPEKAEQLYLHFVGRVQSLGIRVQTGRFQAHMAVSLTNDGPVTLVVEG